ncbi:hypothetical protein H2248_006801 [Termitomyces sp. 'cryptogamus']|nr:hypothetical protein H2248_006801 [Termitomyces sp. 'cryptogamus']
MPRHPRNKNKNLPKILQPGVQNFEHWGRRCKDIFPNGPSFTSSHHTAGNSSQSEVLPIIQYRYPSSADDTSGENPDDLSFSIPHTGNNQSSSSSSSYHPSNQRSPRPSRNIQRSRHSRYDTRQPVNDCEASQPLTFSDLSSSSPSPPTRQSGLVIELNHDCSPQIPTPFFRSPQLYPVSPEPQVSSEPSYISESVAAYTTSQTASPWTISGPHVQNPASNLGTSTGSFSPGLDPFSVDFVQANYPAAQYTPFSGLEPQNSLHSFVRNQGHFNDANTPIYPHSIYTPLRDFSSPSQSTLSSTPYSSHPSDFTTDTSSAHASSSSLYSMTQHYHPNSSQSLDQAIKDDSGRTSPSFYNNLLSGDFPSPLQSQTYPNMPVIATGRTYTTSSRDMSQMGSPRLQITPSSSQLMQTIPGYVSTNEDNASMRDDFFPPGMNYQTRSHSYQEQLVGVSQRRDNGSSQRTRHSFPGSAPMDPSTGHNYHSPIAIASSPMSSVNHHQRY